METIPVQEPLSEDIPTEEPLDENPLIGEPAPDAPHTENPAADPIQEGTAGECLITNFSTTFQEKIAHTKIQNLNLSPQ